LLPSSSTRTPLAGSRTVIKAQDRSLLNPFDGGVRQSRTRYVPLGRDTPSATWLLSHESEVCDVPCRKLVEFPAHRVQKPAEDACGALAPARGHIRRTSPAEIAAIRWIVSSRLIVRECARVVRQSAPDSCGFRRSCAVAHDEA
jgi:hypothetical protein